MLSTGITSEEDVYRAISLVNYLIKDHSFDELQKQCIFITVLEVTRNVLIHGGGNGLFRCEINHEGFRFTCSDKGPGIKNLDAVLQGTYKSAHGLGIGLASVKKLMDEFNITSSAEGTEIVGFKRARGYQFPSITPSNFHGTDCIRNRP